MENLHPQKVVCAVCGRGGRHNRFRRPGASDMNWVEIGGYTYMVCQDHIDSVTVDGPDWEPRFRAESSILDLERKIEQLSRDLSNVLDVLREKLAGRR